MNSKKLKQNPSLAYTSHPDYRKPPQIANPHLQCLGAPHIDSFNFMATDGIKAAIADIIPVEFELPNGQRIKITIDEAAFAKPLSKNCHLADLSPEELIKHNEHADEWGGYFIIKGHERLARMLLVTRRNYPVAIKRSGWKMRGNLFSDYEQCPPFPTKWYLQVDVLLPKSDVLCTIDPDHKMFSGLD
ncbi:hypothetical protein MSG28_000328 [Choristoneura fumiferana]|uniref:Uncharacterized protein n=1 Tax=Choristoneura fumiferana TaxID=7141 RepID=A0ACC0K047_CHOFU|nr:hypothetical protein MSG28_000328 [Choristoneura fumiferana]